jgi:hypothetical protein
MTVAMESMDTLVTSVETVTMDLFIPSPPPLLCSEADKPLLSWRDAAFSFSKGDPLRSTSTGACEYEGIVSVVVDMVFVQNTESAVVVVVQGSQTP